jgi:hypothetical protein
MIQSILPVLHVNPWRCSCARLYEMMSLYQEAVNMALLVSLELAKEIAGKLPDEHPDKKVDPLYPSFKFLLSFVFVGAMASDCPTCHQGEE